MARLRAAPFAVAAVLAAAAGVLGHDAAAADKTTRAEPFPAWPEPKINGAMSVEEAKAIVAERTRPQTEWHGPTSGPKASTGDVTIVYVSADQSYVSFVNWGQGIIDAATALGWNVVVLNGKGTVSGTLAAMQQALSMHPTAIVTSADAGALQAPIKKAVAEGIPVVGIHATAYPGPSPELGLFTNITSNPAEIGQSQAAYVIATSGGKAHVAHMLDNSFAIARFKAKAATDPIKNCEGCKFLEMVNIPIGEQARRIPPAVSGLLANYGDSWWVTTCCDNFFPYVASALRSSGASPEKIRLVGSDGPPSAYDMIRKGNFEVATVPEPSTLFGYQAVDAVVRAMAGEPPAPFIQPTYLVTKDNVDAEGGDKDQFIPSNGFACHYLAIWRGPDAACH
ncbi:MAG: substrate-binding domain-containing protein [Rhodospirillaceae bacterium]|nr:substrate-binding domain-containing protein [Rhodospirillaceae bacterium]